jgi:ATP-dependent DNA helicase RecG
METKKADTPPLNTPVMYVKGVGEYRARLLAKLGIHNVNDLMEYFPRNYINRVVNPTLEDMQVGEIVSFTAMISWVDERLSSKGKKILHLGVNDGKVGLVCAWFRYPASYLKLFRPGITIWLSGMLSSFNGELQMTHPTFEIVEDGKEEDDFFKKRSLLPIYPLTEGLSQMQMRRIILNAFEHFAHDIQESLPDSILARHDFPSRREALQIMHFSSNPDRIQHSRIRFVYEEFLFSQILWARHRRHHKEEVKGINFVNEKLLTTALKNKLSFPLTGAQKRVIREIFADMCSDKQMSRLVQGDVGSGKTIVSLFAMLLAVENDYQAVLMAPTEILAEQHYQNFSHLLEDLGIKTVLLKGGNFKGKNKIKKQIADGDAQIVIGTHALIQKDSAYCRLGLVVIDEQHRFGVEQRARLAKFAARPELLYLSATPIPRSLAMTVYGDLEVSRIDEMPKGRKPVQTYIRSDQKLATVYKDVRKELLSGRQAYFVCPLVEESEKLALLDAQRLYEHLRNKVFPDFSVEIIHGRMAAQNKDDIMRRFKAGEIKILVSTTVIEVGVDVANASVMVIEHAERFGLSQLHQLRGRVGRGSDQAYCFLVWHQPLGKVARQRLDIMSKSSDGFVIAEKDLDLRGPGELFGLEQSGIPQFKHANLVADQQILQSARADAFAIVEEDPNLSQNEYIKLRETYIAKYHKREELIQY